MSGRRDLSCTVPACPRVRDTRGAAGGTGEVHPILFPPLSPPPPPPATAGTLACRVGSGVYLTTPFAGASASSHRLSSVSLHCLPPWDRLGPSPCCVQASGLSGTRVPSPAASGSESKAPSGAGRGGGQTKQAQAREAGRDSVSAVMREKLFSHLSIYTFTMMITFTDCF